MSTRHHSEWDTEDGRIPTPTKTLEHLSTTRAEKKRLGICINAPLHGGPSSRGLVHGPVIGSGVRCQRCIDVHRLGIVDARAKWEREAVNILSVDAFEAARQSATPAPTPSQCVRNECAIRGVCTQATACILLPRSREDIYKERTPDIGATEQT